MSLWETFFFWSDLKAPSIDIDLGIFLWNCKPHSTFRINGRIFLHTMKGWNKCQIFMNVLMIVSSVKRVNAHGNWIKFRLRYALNRNIVFESVSLYFFLFEDHIKIKAQNKPAPRLRKSPHYSSFWGCRLPKNNTCHDVRSRQKDTRI